MPQRIVQVDAFTDRPFAGNPAAVCILTDPRPDSWMQALASELNLSETAFLVPEPGGFHLRWFTPLVEVELCGHATLASAHVLWDENHLEPSAPAIFRTRSGELRATLSDGWIALDFPGRPVERSIDPAPFAQALGVAVVNAWMSRTDVLVEVESAAIVRDLQPDFGLLGAVRARGIIVTARSDSAAFDFVSRFFAPSCGVAEDPVTGSAHCTLGPYWADRLGKSELVGYQASRRGGIVRVVVDRDRILLRGQAVTVLRGELAADAVGD